MDLSTANRVADQLLQEAAEKQTRKAQRTAHWASVVGRLQIAFNAIVFAGLGYTNAQRFFHNPFAQVVVGTAIGLAAAAAFPAKLLSGLTVP